MLGSEIMEYADLSEAEKQQVEEIFKMFTKDWNTGKVQFRCGVIATIGYLKNKKLIQ